MHLKYFTFLLIICLSITLLIPASDGFAQGLRVDDKIGGNGSSGSGQSSNSDNSFIYIAGGVVIAGIVVYALLRNKSDKKEKDESDSSNVSLNELLEFHQSTSDQITELKDRVPVNFYFGMSKESAFISEKKYSFGISFRL